MQLQTEMDVVATITYDTGRRSVCRHTLKSDQHQTNKPKKDGSRRGCSSSSVPTPTPTPSIQNASPQKTQHSSALSFLPPVIIRRPLYRESTSAPSTSSLPRPRKPTPNPTQPKNPTKPYTYAVVAEKRDPTHSYTCISEKKHHQDIISAQEERLRRALRLVVGILLRPALFVVLMFSPSGGAADPDNDPFPPAAAPGASDSESVEILPAGRARACPSFRSCFSAGTPPSRGLPAADKFSASPATAPRPGPGLGMPLTATTAAGSCSHETECV